MLRGGALKTAKHRANLRDYEITFSTSNAGKGAWEVQHPTEE